MEVLQRTANRGSISTGFDIENSCKFEPDNSESMSRTPSSNGNLKTCTLSFWVKITELNKSHMFFTGDYGGASNPWFVIGLISDKIYISSTAGVSGASVQPSRLLRDTSAWYHLVFAFDTTQGTAADRIKIYVNGVQETVFSSTTYPSQNDDLDIMAAKAQGIAGYNDGTDYRFAGYMSEFVGIDGQALAPTEFGEFDEDSGIWKPIDVSGLTFGTNGFYLDFADSANLGNDASGGLDFTETNIAAADQSTDTPTNNFATINTLPFYNQGTFSFPNGATEIKRSDGGGDGWTCVFSTMAVNKGKWYAEMEVLESPSLTMYGYASVAYIQSLNFPQFYLGTTTASAGYYSNGDGANDSIYEGDAYPSAGVQSSAGTIIGIALDCDNNKIHFSNNGTYTNSSNPATNANGFAIPDDYVYFAQSSLTGAKTYKTNLGGYTTDSISSAASDANGYGTFEYAPPSGYYALCTKNLAQYG